MILLEDSEGREQTARMRWLIWIFAVRRQVSAWRGPYDLAVFTLRKHAYPNILKILSPKHENFQIKNSDIFHIAAQNIDCGYS